MVIISVIQVSSFWKLDHSFVTSKFIKIKDKY